MFSFIAWQERLLGEPPCVFHCSPTTIVLVAQKISRIFCVRCSHELGQNPSAFPRKVAHVLIHTLGHPYVRWYDIVCPRQPVPATVQGLKILKKSTGYVSGATAYVLHIPR